MLGVKRFFPPAFGARQDVVDAAAERSFAVLYYLVTL